MKRLSDLFRSYLGSADSLSERESYRRPARDADYDEAMDELDGFLRGSPVRDADERAHRAGGSGARGSGGGFTGSSSHRVRPDQGDERLRQAYADLGLPYGAAMDEVKQAYKRLLHTYHPDRFSADAEKNRTAGEITARLNEAYARIKRSRPG